MTSETPPRQSQTIALRVSMPTTNFPAPEAANWFQVSRVGTDVQLLVGYLDLFQIHQSAQAKGGEQPTLEPLITHRLFLAAQGFGQLRAQIEEIYAKLVEAGVYPAEEDKVNVDRPGGRSADTNR